MEYKVIANTRSLNHLGLMQTCLCENCATDQQHATVKPISICDAYLVMTTGSAPSLVKIVCSLQRNVARNTASTKSSVLWIKPRIARTYPSTASMHKGSITVPQSRPRRTILHNRHANIA